MLYESLLAWFDIFKFEHWHTVEDLVSFFWDDILVI